MKRFSLLIFILFSSSAVLAAGESVTYQVDNELYEGYYISPSADAPVVLLFHDWDGLTDYEIKRAEMLADNGYAVFAADLFGKGIRPTEVKDKRQHTGELYEDRQQLRKLMIAAIDAAISKGANISNAVAIGYCFGGAAALELARAGAPLNGFAIFHGGLKTPEGQDYSRTRGKVIVFHGEADSSVTMDEFNQLEVELENNNVTHEMISYEGAPHAFTLFGSDRYREDADKDSWERLNTFLKETL